MTRKVFLVWLALVLALSVGLVACTTSELKEEEETYALTVTSTAGGAVSPWGTTTYDDGEEVDLKAVAASGFVFVNWEGGDTIVDANDATTTITMDADYSITANFVMMWPVEPPYYPVIMVAAGGFHTVGLKADGTVVATGDNEYGQCDVGDWEGIVQIAAGIAHTVGLKNDGTVIVVGNNDYGQCDCPGWNDIVQIGAGISYTVGLREDGTVVAVGDSAWWQPSAGFCLIPPCPVPVEDITQIATGVTHIVALREDGSVIAVGNNAYGQCNCPGWNDVVQIAAGGGHTVGLMSDGSVIAVGDNTCGQCDVLGNMALLQPEDDEGEPEEEDEPIQTYPNPLVQIAAGGFHTVCIYGNGETGVVAVGDNEYGQCDVEDWTNIAYVSAGYQHTVAIRNDGSVVAVGNNDHGQCDCPGWNMCPGW